MSSPRTGSIALAGLPNAGKSTLLNRLVGEQLAIVSPRPQTTRMPVVGIRTTGDVQMIFVDTPGLLEPEYELHSRMRALAQRALREADVIVHVTDATKSMPAPLHELAGLDVRPKGTMILALNKCDLLSGAQRAALADVANAILISAANGEGVDTLEQRIAAALPEREFRYPADDLATQPMRFFAAEFVRGAALAELEEEIPYAVACEIEEFREDRTPVYIRATLYVERESQKRIVVGSKGARIRSIGMAARRSIEALLGASVYLDLWVKVAPHWRREPGALDRLGYGNPK